MKPQIIITETSFNKIKTAIEKNKNKTIIFSSNDDELNRKVLEKLEINILLLKQSKRKDFQKQRNSGFNQVIAKITKKKNIAIGIDLDEIINFERQNKSDIIARVRQNVKLCNKNKLKMKFISEKYKRDIYSLKALGLILGMNTSMTKTL